MAFTLLVTYSKFNLSLISAHKKVAYSPVGNDMFKVNNRNSRTRCFSMFKVNNKDTKTTPMASF